MTITVSDVNEPPDFVVPSASLEVEENAVANTNIGDPIAAIDPESAELMYSLGGVDASLFDIDASTGQINVGAATTLDYESPEDSNGDNIYELAVKVTDGEDGVRVIVGRHVSQSGRHAGVGVEAVLLEADLH